MPRKLPAIGEDVSHLFGGGSAPEIGDDVSHLFDAPTGLYDPKRKPVSAEDFAPAQRDVSIGNVLLNTAKSLNPLPAIKAAMADQRPEDAALGPGAVLAPFIRAAGAGAKSEAGKAAADVGRGRYSEAAGHAAAAALPLVGPAAAQAGEDIGSGETERIERGAGSAIGLVGGMVAPRVTAAVAPRVAPALATIGEQIASKGRSIAPVLKEAAKTAIVEGAAHAVGAPPLVGSALRVILREALNKGRKAAPEVVNTGGRVVKDSALTDEQALVNALEELRAPASATRVTAPPEPTLPPGYTPRATVPKAAPAPQAELTPAVAEPGQASLGPDAQTTPYQGTERRVAGRVDAATDDALYEASRAERARSAARFKQTSPGALENQRMAAARAKLPKAVQAEIEKAAKSVPEGRRAYFLKSAEQMAEEAAAGPPKAPTGKRPYFLKPVEELAEVAEEAVTPSGSITPDDLPASWRKHTGQDLFPITGEEGKAVAAALKEELKAQGMSVGEAMARVSGDKSIPTRERAQLIRALNQSYAKR